MIERATVDASLSIVLPLEGGQLKVCSELAQHSIKVQEKQADV